MHVPSQIRRIVVIALLVGAVLAGWSSAATARPLYDRNLESTSTAEPPTVVASDGRDWTPILVAGAVVLVLAGTIGYSYRARPDVSLHVSSRAD
jgi:hypothetical protein